MRPVPGYFGDQFGTVSGQVFEDMNNVTRSRKNLGGRLNLIGVDLPDVAELIETPHSS